jgi:hypothetical protein
MHGQPIIKICCILLVDSVESLYLYIKLHGVISQNICNLDTVVTASHNTRKDFEELFNHAASCCKFATSVYGQSVSQLWWNDTDGGQL